MSRRLGLLAILCLLLIGCAAGPEPSASAESAESTGQTQTSEDVAHTNWPVTCEEAIARLVHDLDPESRERVRTTPRDKLILFHFGWGTGIRNGFGLWQGNKQLFDSCMERVPGQQPHPDTVSMVIIEGVWEALQAQANGGT